MLHLASRLGLVLALVATACATVAEDGEASSGTDTLGLFLTFGILGGLFWLLLVRPQRRRQRQMEDLRDALEVGDEVRTVGGIYGKVKTITDADIIIDVGDGTTLRIARRAIAERLGAVDE